MYKREVTHTREHSPAFGGAVLAAVTMLLWHPAGSAAPGGTDPLETCYQMTDATAQLACFRAEMQRRHARASSSPSPGAPASLAPSRMPVAPQPAQAARTDAPAPQPRDETIGLDGKQLSAKRRELGIKTETPQPIVTTLEKLERRPGGSYFFELNNGQLWESTDTVAHLFLRMHGVVTVRPGVLGAFFLKTEEGNSIRVHRLR